MGLDFPKTKGNHHIKSRIVATFKNFKFFYLPRGGSRTAAISKMEHFVIIVNGWKPLTIITKRSILDAAVALDPPMLPFRIRAGL